MFKFRFVLAACVLALAAACGSSSPSAPSTTFNPSPTPSPTPGSNAVVIPSGAQTLGTAAFNPNPIMVSVGSTVTWTNNDSISHTATSNTGAFDSGLIGAGGSFSFTFQSAGTFPYHCTIHPGMVGSVVVQ
jgi:plastocyanin